MKIAFIYDTIYPWVTGGAERRIYEIGKRLAKHGHDIHIFSLGYWTKTKEYKDKKIIEYDGMTLHSVGKPMDLYTKKNKRSIKEALYFAKCLITQNELKDFDIIDCQGFPYFSCFPSYYLSKIGRSKLIITLHEVWNDYWYEYMGKKGGIGKFIEQRIFHLTDNIICVSSLTKNNLLENHSPPNTIVIPNGVNRKKIIYIDPGKEYCDVLFAGRLIPEKQVDLLVNAIKKVSKIHPYVKCMIIGEGPSKNKLIEMSKTMNIESNVIFKDFYENNEDLYKDMKCASVFVLPSKREGFGIITIEANACGLPVITINHPMNASKDLIINNKNGWVIPNDVDVLRDVIIQIIEKGVSSELRNNCRELSKEYTWNKITLMTENYYYKILNN